jgi:hypothetical protein
MAEVDFGILHRARRKRQAAKGLARRIAADDTGMHFPLAVSEKPGHHGARCPSPFNYDHPFFLSGDVDVHGQVQAWRFDYWQLLCCGENPAPARNQFPNSAPGLL